MKNKIIFGLAIALTTGTTHAADNTVIFTCGIKQSPANTDGDAFIEGLFSDTRYVPIGMPRTDINFMLKYNTRNQTPSELHPPEPVGKYTFAFQGSRPDDPGYPAFESALSLCKDQIQKIRNGGPLLEPHTSVTFSGKLSQHGNITTPWRVDCHIDKHLAPLPTARELTEQEKANRAAEKEAMVKAILQLQAQDKAKKQRELLESIRKKNKERVVGPLVVGSISALAITLTGMLIYKNRAFIGKLLSPLVA